MHIRLKFLSQLILGTILFLCGIGAPAQTWQAMASPCPTAAGVPLLLTDGSVMVQHFDAADWYKLTPNSFGDYSHGTWTRLADLPAGYGPLYYASAVLKDGRVIIIGGEYNFGSAVWTNKAAVYDPVLNVWTAFAAPPGWTGIGDAQCCVMPDGKFLLANPFDTRIAILDPTTMTWTTLVGSGKVDRFDEEGWTLMPDGTILTVDAIRAPHTEKYIPWNDQWISAGDTPQSLTHAQSQEMGPNTLLPDGRVLATGATGHNAMYTPGPNPTDPGTWASVPDFPLLNGVQLGIADGPAVLLPNGRVLTSASPGIFVAPTKFFEFDGSNWVPVPSTPRSGGNPCYVGNFLMLPNGQVLYTDFSTDVQIYTPTGGPQESWRPTITNCPAILKAGQSFVITGTQFNGLSQCCTYGDDASNATNYPIVRITNSATGHVVYCKTSGHSTMAVATGSTPTSTNVLIPATIENGASTIEVVTNGIASLPLTVSVGSNAIEIPRLKSVTPNTVQANSPAFTIEVKGEKFSSTDSVMWVDGATSTPLTTTFVSKTTLQATVPATLITTVGTKQVRVKSTTNRLTNTLPFVVTSDVPLITTLTPNTAEASGPTFTMLITGQNFNDRNTVSWTLNSVTTQLTTTFVSATQLSVVVPASAYVNFGNASVVVKTALGTSSNAAVFVVTSNLPQINSLSPSSIQAGGPDFTLAVNGIRFKPTDLVQFTFNGIKSNLATTYVNSGQLTAIVPAALTRDFGNATVDVVNANNQLSNLVNFTITTDVPQITTISPSSIPAFSPDTTIAISGLRFKSSDVVKWTAGSTTTVLAATFISSNQWNAVVPASLLLGGTATVAVYDFRGRPSNGFVITMTNPIPILNLINPTSAMLNSPSFTMDLTGDLFVPGAVVEWRDGGAHFPLATTYLSKTALRAVVPGALLSVAGTYNIVVVNPSPGGGESLAQKFDVLADPILTQINPNSGKKGVGFSMRLRGGGFVNGATVNFDGTILQATFVSSSELTCSIPGSALPDPATVDVSVINPGNIETDPLPFTITP